MNQFLSHFGGLQVISSEHAVQPQETTVPASFGTFGWIEKLVHAAERYITDNPCAKDELLEVRMVPQPTAYRFQDKIIAHPSIIADLKKVTIA